MQPKKLTGLHEQLMRAVAGEISFARITDMIADQHSAAGGIIFELNRKTGCITNYASSNLVIGEGGYNEHLNSINPRMRYSLRHAPGHIVYENKFIDAKGMAQHEFYDWLKRENDMEYFIGSRLYDDGDISVFHSIELGNGRGHPEPEEIQEFSRTSRAIGNAWKLAKRLQPDALEPESGGWTPEYLPWAIFALSATGMIVQLNSRAAKMIREGQVLYSEDNQLHARDLGSEAQFQTMLQNTSQGQAQDMLLQDVVTRTRIVAQSLPAQTGALSTPSPISILIYVWNPMDGEAGDKSETLRALWNLTEAEARLALLLARGATLADAADAFSITRNTARNQLQCIFEKMRVNRQTELALHIFGVIER